MPRSSRNKSSKHSSRDARDFSDSERDSGVKDRKDLTRESSVKASKELASGEKRKLDSKENKESFGSGNAEYSEEYTSSKRRKERLDGSANDRWNGGGQDDRGEKKSKASSELRSTKRRDESVGVFGDVEESGKKSSGKIEGKHRGSSGKDGEREKDREGKGKEGKSERVVDGEDHHSVTKQVAEKTDSFAQDQLQSPELENQFERRIKRKRDGSGDGDKHRDDVGDVNGRRQSSKDDITKDGRLKDEKHKDERYKDKYRDDMDKDNRHRDEKQRDENITRDHVHSRSNEKYLRDGKDTTEARQKKVKAQQTDRNREHDDDRDYLGRDYDLDHNNYHEREGDRDRDRGHARDRGRDRVRNHDRERDRDRDHECDRDRDRDWDWDRDRDRECDRDVDHDGSHLDDRSARYKDSRGKKRSPDDPDDYNDNKSRSLRAPYHDAEKKSLSSGRVEPDADRGRSQPRQAHQETTGGSRRRSSPSSSSHGGPDGNRHFKSEDSKYRDGGTEQRSRANSSRHATGFSGSSERASKYRSSEKPMKPDDGYMGEFSAERPSSSKASPIGLVDRSPSSTSLERKHMSRTGTRRSLDIEESGRRSSASMGARDSSVADDRFGRDFPLADGSPHADSSLYSRTGQGISSSFATPPITFRGGVGSPFLGSLEEDTRVGARYRRNSDPNLSRVLGNAWRGPPNWSSQVPNGFISFQHGPPHGGFQTMMPQFSSPPMFGVRPSMDINPSDIPYPFPDADRFTGNLRPLGWQNMMDGSAPPHLHGWDGSNGVYRDEPNMYGGPDWEQNRHHVNGRGWDSSGDAWMEQNSDVSTDLPLMSQKEDLPMQSMVDDVHTGQVGQKSQYENNHGTVKLIETASVVASPSKEMPKSSPKVTHEKSSDPTKTSKEDGVTQFFRAYLSKIDISTELTDPELYGQCMNLLNIEQNGMADRDTNMLVSLKDGGRAISKSSSSFLGLKLLPAADDSVYQRAMDLYKKQRVKVRALENVCSGELDIISASNLGKVEEPVNVCNAERVEEPNSILDTAMQEKAETVATAVPEDELEESVPMYDSAILEVPNQEKAEAAAVSAEDKLEEPASTPSRVVLDQVTPTPNKLEVSDDGSPVEPVQNLSGEGVDEITSEQADREDARGDLISTTSDDASCAAPLLVTDSKGNKEVIKGEASGDAVRGPLPLFLPEGSPKESGSLLPGSNESVILSRIHHSPESTH
ncbi:hypothetical protein HS088_TW19G00849 [Tripterygium wilfordii]|uniref:Uncharacterized protein n=1 Tax=Tripterygium wilfordii TaxID=458696 RepID=A0A7J7CAT7_TRIWF|nr:uncharacterized protein LOC119985647 [Tripterygium wilfordii]KAF5731243.1 hypothetical protein HS088_TW19G00849 [Tripterygium wilfordii]